MAWLRLYDSILDDPKIQMLSDRAFRMLINLWCLAKRNNGVIPSDVNSLAFSLRCPAGKVRDTIQALISANLIERTSDGYEPHKWDEYQYESDSAAERMRRHRLRNKQRNALRNSDVPDTDTEQNRTEKTPLPPLFEEFWNKFPTQPVESKPKTEIQWRALTTDEQQAAIDAIAPFRAFCAKDKTYTPPYAATFLAERRFVGFATSIPDPAKSAEAKDRADRLLKRGAYAEAAE